MSCCLWVRANLTTALCHFSITQVHEGCSGCSPWPGWVKFERSFRRCHCLTKQLVLCWWHFPAGSFFNFVIRQRPVSNVLRRVGSCCEVHKRSIPRGRLRWRSSDRRPGSCGTPGIIHLPASPNWSLGSPGWGLRISDSRRLNCRSVLVVWNWHHSVHVTLHQCHHWHLVEKTDLIDPSRQRRENNTNILRQHHWNLSLLIQHLRLSCSRPCWGTLTCWAAPPAESAPAESSRSAGSASPAESSSSAESASPAKSSTTAGSSSPAKSSSSAYLA